MTHSKFFQETHDAIFQPDKKVIKKIKGYDAICWKVCRFFLKQETLLLIQPKMGIKLTKITKNRQTRIYSARESFKNQPENFLEENTKILKIQSQI